ncbi:hypothetical protein D3C87_2041810 [compost metagenome]
MKFDPIQSTPLQNLLTYGEKYLMYLKIISLNMETFYSFSTAIVRYLQENWDLYQEKIKNVVNYSNIGNKLLNIVNSLGIIGLESQN